MKDENDKDLSPCIVSGATFALEIKLLRPKNIKTCSKGYWIKVIDVLLEKNIGKEGKRQNAINCFDEYVKK